MKKCILTLAAGLVLSSCVTGSPSLTPDQKVRAYDMEIFEAGFIPEKKYTPIEEISGTDCSGGGAGSRVTGTKEPALYNLKLKAVGLNADTVVDVWCKKTAVFLSNCWAPMQCKGTAVKWAE